MRQSLRFGAHSTRTSIVRGQSRAFAVPRGKGKLRFWSVRVGNASCAKQRGVPKVLAEVARTDLVSDGLGASTATVS